MILAASSSAADGRGRAGAPAGLSALDVLTATSAMSTPGIVGFGATLVCGLAGLAGLVAAPFRPPWQVIAAACQSDAAARRPDTGQ